jgi:hypothetical protein
MRKKRGVRPGTPDTLIRNRGKLVTLELKSRQGRCSVSQRRVRAALGMLLGACGDVGAARGGRDVPDNPPGERRNRVLVAARARAVGSAATGPGRAATHRTGSGGAATGGTPTRGRRCVSPLSGFVTAPLDDAIASAAQR